jgi:hypothetical protein
MQGADAPHTIASRFDELATSATSIDMLKRLRLAFVWIVTRAIAIVVVIRVAPEKGVRKIREV